MATARHDETHHSFKDEEEIDAAQGDQELPHVGLVFFCVVSVVCVIAMVMQTDGLRWERRTKVL